MHFKSQAETTLLQTHIPVKKKEKKKLPNAFWTYRSLRTRRALKLQCFVENQNGTITIDFVQ